MTHPGEKNGMAASLLYQYSQKSLGLFGMLEFMEKDFRMDTAFFQRSGITKVHRLHRSPVLSEIPKTVLDQAIQSLRSTGIICTIIRLEETTCLLSRPAVFLFPQCKSPLRLSIHP
jgi:hypothetical protein